MSGAVGRQLHYTSARSGPTDRAGFQFVAETPGIPAGVRAAVTPFMTYRPPPEAPLSPTAAELPGFPVAFGYDLVDGSPLLVRVRYLGRDYSGRYGNFFAHALLVEPEELEGLRPIELWQSPCWHEAPAPGELLPAVDYLTPGDAFAPEALAQWLAAWGSYGLLAELLDGVAEVLARGHGRVVLVASDTELIARWIAVVSYSLPVAIAARLSFITYSADPDTAPYRLVGTTPDAWATAHHTGSVFALDDGRDRPEAGSRFARAVVAAWRRLDFIGLDALGELAVIEERAERDGLAAALDRAAALLALCRGEPKTAAPDGDLADRGHRAHLGEASDEEADAVRLLTRYGRQVPDWVWEDLVPRVPEMGFDLALAVHGWAGPAGAAEVAERCATRCAALALLHRDLRPRVPRLGVAGAEQVGPLIAEALAVAPDLAEIASIITLADRIGAAAPEQEVASAAARCVRLGATDLPAALTALPDDRHGPMLAGVLNGLRSAADDATLASVLSDAACDLLAGHFTEAWRAPGPEAPDQAGGPARDAAEADVRTRTAVPVAAGVRVLASVGRRHRERRLEVTAALLRLGASEGQDLAARLEAALLEVWWQPPTVAECTVLLTAHADVFARVPALAGPLSAALAALVDDLEHGDSAVAVRLAERVRAVLPEGCRAERDAAVLLAYADALRATTPQAFATSLRTVLAADGSSPRLTGLVLAGAADAAARRRPEFRARLLAATPSGVRSRIAAVWTSGRMSRTARNELVEVVLRARRLKVTEPHLDSWARATAAKWFTYRQLDAHLRDEPELRAALKSLTAEDGAPGGPPGGPPEREG